MDVYEYTDYREIIRHRVKELSVLRKGLTLRKLSEKIPVQYTYFSKALNDPKTHLNEDHLFSVCEMLEFFPEELDYVMLLRSRALAASQARKIYLQGKIDRARKAKRKTVAAEGLDTQRLSQEMAYLFDPESYIIHLSLHIDEYFRNPKKLCAPLGMTPSRLQEIMAKLAQLGFIELAADGTLVKVEQRHIHYQTDHPLMRVHQSLLRSFCTTQLIKLSEEEKHNTMVTFTSDPETFEKIREMFIDFLEKVERKVVPSKNKNTYQINFDLFKWL